MKAQICNQKGKASLLAVPKLSVLFLVSLLFAASASAQTVLDNLFSPSDIPYLRQSRLYHLSSYDTTGGNHDYITIPAGQTATVLDVDGPGVIARIWMTVGSSDPYYMRRILIRMYWDGESYPSVEVPLGDFFGTGFGYKQYTSRFVGMSSGGFYCYFPMPFNKSARIDIVNQTGIDIDSYYYNIDYQKLVQPFDSTVGYFHAWWHRVIRTTSRDNYVILDAEGHGQFVGCNLNLQGYDGNLWFLEGDEMIYVDGESKPSVNGTGTEDFFNSGWYFNHGEFSAPYHGLILKDDSTSRIAAYRFFVGDAVPFEKSIRVTIEHGTENTEAADYSSTAYWYQSEPHRPFPAMLKPSLRIPLRVAVPNGAVEADSLSLNQTSLKSEVEDMSDLGADWSGSKQLKVAASKSGDAFVLNVPVKEPDIYSVRVYYTKGGDYGNTNVICAGKRVGRIDGYSQAVIPGGAITLRHLRTDRDFIRLLFVSAGKNEASKGYSLGLDAFVAQPERHYISKWNVIGPFPNPKDSSGNRLGIDLVYPPEREIILGTKYFGANGQRVGWHVMKVGKNGMMDFVGKFNPDELVVAYAATYVYSAKRQNVPLLLGSDDGVKVFLNGKESYRKLVIRSAEPDADKILLPLRKGWNTLLLKIENNLGGYGFYARLLDTGKGLKYSAAKH